MGASKSTLSSAVPLGPSTETITKPSAGALQQLAYIKRYLERRAEHGGVIALRNHAAEIAAKPENSYLGAAKVLDFIQIPDPTGTTLGLNVMVLQMLTGGDPSDLEGQSDSESIDPAILGVQQSTSKADRTAQTIDIDPTQMSDPRVKQILSGAMEGLDVTSADWANIFLVNVYTPGYKALNFALLEWMLENVRIVSGGMDPQITQGKDADGNPTPIIEVPIAALGQETDRLACEATTQLMEGAGVCNSCSVSGMSEQAKSQLPATIEAFNAQFQSAWEESSDINENPMTTFKFSCPEVVLSGPVVSGANMHCRSLGIIVKRATQGGNPSFYVVAEDLSYYAMAALIKLASDAKYADALTWAHPDGTPGTTMITQNLSKMPAVYAAANPEFMAHVSGWGAEKTLLLNTTFNCSEVDQNEVQGIAEMLIQKGFTYTASKSVPLASTQQARELSWQSQTLQDNMMS